MGSRRQCRLRATGDKWVLEDLNGRERYDLHAGDQAQIGGLTIRLQADPAAAGLGDDRATVAIMNDLINGLLADGPAAAAPSRTAGEVDHADRRKAG